MGEKLVEKLANDLLFKVNTLQEYVNSSEWKQFSRRSFIRALNNSIEKLEEILGTIKAIHERLEKDPSVESPDLKPLIEAYENQINVLKRNLALEKGRSLEEEIDLKEKIEVPELYASLSEKILSLLLKTRFLIEQVHLHSKAERITPLEEKTTAKNIISLLKAKEKELQEIKEKYEELKHHAFLGKTLEKDSSDLEHEVHGLMKKIEAEKSLLEKELSVHRKQLDYASDSLAALKQKTQVLEQMLSKLLEKNLELISMLKKERDFAKKIVLDIEHETLQLRSAYSRELLNLQEAKLKAKEEERIKWQKKLNDLERQLREKDVLLDQFKKIAFEKEEKIGKLEKKLEEKEKPKTTRKRKAKKRNK
jgi:hypothetical protein